MQAPHRFGSNWEGIEGWLADAAGRWGVPGAALAVLSGGRIHAATTGHVNIPADIRADANAVFHIGSITKPFTATLAMILMERGAFTLDTPVRDLLPEWQTVSPAKQRQVHIRHLLNHTSGLDGDQLLDTGRGADCLERLVARCADTGFLHKPGALFSYCNFGYLLLGRIIEKATQSSWDEALRAELTGPLGLSRAVVLPDHLLRHRVALGHSGNQASGYTLAPLWPRSNAASGARLAMTASDLLAFAAFHLSGGLSASGTRLVHEASIAAMRTASVATPYSPRYTGWGLGWMIFDWGQDVFGHDGGVAGMSAYLRIFPRQNAAFALMMNGGKAPLLARAAMEEMARALAGIETLPRSAEPDSRHAAGLERFAGRYVRHGLTLDLRSLGDTLELATGGAYEDAPACHILRPCAADSFVMRLPDLDMDVPVHFSDLDSCGRPRFIHLYERVFRRLDG